ncbi:MAG: hypothetical protein OXR73_36220 [Myxococcales bacterium]|nr:hypothetical protein [Myxococcales bacterium]
MIGAFRLSLILALIVALTALGCGSDEDAEQDGPAAGDGASEFLDPAVDWTALNLVYPKMYSAHDGVHVFQVPVYVNNIATDPEDWRAMPADAVTFDAWQSDDGEQTGVLITVQRPEPLVTIAASAGSIGGTAELHVTTATEAEWAIGEERYKNGAPFDIQSFTQNSMLDLSNFEIDLATGTVRIVDADISDFGNPTDLRCDTCHTAGAENFQIQHTPTQAARFSDEELIKVFTEGTKPDGVGFRVLPRQIENFYQYFHTWEVSEEQARGLVIYLRSLTPQGQGDILLPTGGFMPPPGFTGFGGFGQMSQGNDSGGTTDDSDPATDSNAGEDAEEEGTE